MYWSEKNYPIHLFDITHQVYYRTPKKIQPFEEFNTDPDKINARLFVILVRHRQIEMISDGNEIIEVKVI